MHRFWPSCRMCPISERDCVLSGEKKNEQVSIFNADTDTRRTEFTKPNILTCSHISTNIRAIFLAFVYVSIRDNVVIVYIFGLFHSSLVLHGSI